MKKNLAVYVLAAAIVLVGLVFAGLPATALFSLLLLGGCALMMFVMMRGMGGNEHRHDDDNDSPFTRR